MRQCLGITHLKRAVILSVEPAHGYKIQLHSAKYYMGFELWQAQLHPVAIWCANQHRSQQSRLIR